MADASPEDWPRGGGGALCRDLDDAVRCPICGELFETPLSLRCGHAFCSGCVRSSIEFQERSGPATCPQCRDRCDAADLRPAPQLRAVAAAFLAARPLLLASVTAAIAAAAGPPEARTAEHQEQKQQQQLRRRQPPRQAAPRQAEQRQQQQGQQRSRPKLRPRRQPHDAALQQQQHHHQHDGIVSVELSSGSEDNAPTAQAKAAARRQQPKRGWGSSSGPADGADASQSSGSAKRQQLSSPSTAGDESQQLPVPAATAAAAAGRRALRSAGKAAASAAVPADDRRRGSRGSAGPGRPGDAGPGVKTKGDDSTADEAEAEQLASASDSDPEYLGEERASPSSGDDAAAVPPPEPAPAREKLPAGHVRCPNCATMLPAAFINSHLDSCLSAGGAKAGKAPVFGSKGSSGGGGKGAAGLPNGRHSSGGGGTGNSNRTAGNGANAAGVTGSGGSLQGGGAGGRRAAGSRPAAGSDGGGLKVPPKLCVALMSDKAMRDTCKKFGLPATGRKEALAERYSRFRLEVQTANDSGESATYADIARRVLQRESRTAKAAFGMPLARSTANSSPAGVGDSSFEELIKATRQRQAAQRAASGPATSGDSPQVAATEAVCSDAPAGGAAAAAAGQHSSPVPDAAHSEPAAVHSAADERGPTAVPADGHAHASQGTSQQLPLPMTLVPAAAAPAAAEPNMLSSIADVAAPSTNAAGADAAGVGRPPLALPLLDEQSRSASRGLPDGVATIVGGTAAPAGQHQYPHAAAGSNGGGGGGAGGLQLDAQGQNAAARSQPQDMQLGRPGPTQQQPEPPGCGDDSLSRRDAADPFSTDPSQPQEHLQGQPHGWSQHQEAEQVGGAPFEGTGFGGAGFADDVALQGISCTQRPPPLAPALSCGQQLQQQQLLLQPFTFEGAFSDDSRSCPLSPSV